MNAPRESFPPCPKGEGQTSVLEKGLDKELPELYIEKPKNGAYFLEVKHLLKLVQSISWSRSDSRLPQGTQRLHIRIVDHGCVLNSGNV
jgi:hypothetical protein